MENDIRVRMRFRSILCCRFISPAAKTPRFEVSFSTVFKGPSDDTRPAMAHGRPSPQDLLPAERSPNKSEKRFFAKRG
eukprot:1721750-Prymnesium_polylepis.1